MLRSFGFMLLTGLMAALPAAAEPTLTTHVPAEVVSHAATPIGRPDPDRVLELAISLPLRNEAGLDALLRDLYDPASPNFRRWLSVAEFTRRFGPSEADYAALIRFVKDNGLTVRATAPNRRLVDVSASVAAVERVFHVVIGLWRHADGSGTFYAPDREPRLDLAVPVLHVSGLDDAAPPFNHLVREAHTAPHKRTGSGPEGDYIGSDIRAAYYGGTALTGAGQTLGLLEYAGYNIDDVNAYFAEVGEKLDVPVVGVSLNGVPLLCKDKCDDSEQVLDIEEAISMAPHLTQVTVYVGDDDVSILNRMATDDTAAQLSSSWGWTPDPSSDEPIFEEFAAQGQSFVDATGDDGYHLAAGYVWPADDAWVTAVGGTDLFTKSAGGPWKAEHAWVYSGGGPSPGPEKIAIPDWQIPFVTVLNGGSKTWRNVPDIAGDANTDNYSCYDAGCYIGNGGTSYAAPLWAGFLALANEHAARQGKPWVGFLNPTLYRLGAGKRYADQFHDETAGNNGKYFAVPGFDLVTGFGSPAGPALIDALADGG